MKMYVIIGLMLFAMLAGCSKKEDEEVEKEKTHSIMINMGVTTNHQFNYSYSIYSKGERKEYVYESVTREKSILLLDIPIDRDSISGFFNYTGTDSITGIIWVTINGKKVVNRTLKGKSFSAVFELPITAP